MTSEQSRKRKLVIVLTVTGIRDHPCQLQHSLKTQSLPNPRMSKQPIDNAIKIKRKRAPVWPFATRDLCERVVECLIKNELARELTPPDEWRIPPRLKPGEKGFSMRGSFGSLRPNFTSEIQVPYRICSRTNLRNEQ